MKKQWIYRILAVLTLLLCLVNFIILPDTIVTSYKNINGVEYHEYGEKVPTLLMSLVHAAIGSLLLKSSENRAKRPPVKPKPVTKPGKLLPLAGWIFIAMGVWGNIALILINI